jgi:1-acyl-sn-glycerol-3-phosphate acyltransferase
MKALSEFLPPKPNRFLIWLSELLLPLYLWFVDPLTVRFLENSDDPLAFVKRKRVVLVMNHSDRRDPLVVIALAKHMRQSIYCMVAREVFDWNYGILGWVFQRLGCYSVNRGTADIKSIQTTVAVLTHCDHKLIVFPESEITGDDEIVHEVNRSFIHMLLEAQEEIAKVEPNQSLLVLPVGVSYGLLADLETSIDRALSAVERKLEIKHARTANAKERTDTAVQAVLLNLSQYYKCVLSEDESHHSQVRLLARHICHRMSRYMNADYDQNQSSRKLLYSLRNGIAKELAASRSPIAHQQNLRHSASKIYRQFLLDLERVERLLIFQKILNLPSSPIQICRIVDFLEAETCGPMTNKGRQRASVFFGKPIEVLPHLVSYKSSKGSTIDGLTICIRSGLQLALDHSHGKIASE